MKTLGLLLCLVLIGISCFAQGFTNIQYASTITYTGGGATPNNPSAYTWSEISDTKQYDNINVVPPDKGKVYLQLNNSCINYNSIPWGYMLSLWVTYDNGSEQQIFSTTKNCSGWINVPFSTLGYHTLHIRWITLGGTGYTCDYDVYMVPKCNKFYADNYGNTLTTWEGTNSKKVVLISEGFDTYNTTSAEYIRSKGTSLFDPLIQIGYKIYFLNYQYNYQDMRNSAAIYNSAAQYVSSLNSNSSMLAAGISMGGVIVRYALAKAEGNHTPLPFNKFVSIDGPQQGALFSQDFSDFLRDNSRISDFQRAGLNNDAAKQLLVYNSFGNLHTSFYSELNSLNGGTGYPLMTQNIGVSFSNGSPNPGGTNRWIDITFDFDWFVGSYIYKTSWLTSDLTPPGSYLPSYVGSSEGAAGTWGSAVSVSRDPINNPTFIPYNSSLDIVNNLSKFNVKIQANSNHFHDDFPIEITSPLFQAIMNTYSISFQNNFIGVGNGGKISVNGTQYNSPYGIMMVDGKLDTVTALSQTINGIDYTFSNWSTGSTQNPLLFYPGESSTYSANFTGKPNTVNRSLHFNASDPNQPITVIWNEHPNTNVTQYQIWRKVNYKKQGVSSPILIGTVNRGTTSFVDIDYSGTRLGYTDYMLWYDVKPYYSLEHTVSVDNYATVFSDGMLAKQGQDNTGTFSENISENKIENYPNPFNPSTIISYQIVNPGLVSLKVYDCLGKEIADLVNEVKNTGKYEVLFNIDNLASGIYFYRIVANGYHETKKMIRMK